MSGRLAGCLLAALLLAAPVARAGQPGGAVGPKITVAGPVAAGFDTVEGKRVLEMLAPHLSAEERRTLERVRIEFAPDPPPQGHECWSPTQFGYVEDGPGSPRITICMRSLAYFTYYAAVLTSAPLISPKYVTEETPGDYFRLYPRSFWRNIDRPLLAKGDFHDLPCLYLEFVALRQVGGDPDMCLDRSRLPLAATEWIREHPDAMDLGRLDILATLLRVDKAKIRRDWTEMQTKGNLFFALLHTILHETAHVHLGHVASRRRGCRAVREEHAADEFVTRVLNRMFAQELAAAPPFLAKAGMISLPWIFYQFTMIEGTKASEERDRLFEVRAVIALSLVTRGMKTIAVDAEVRRTLQAAGVGEEEFLNPEIERKLAETRTCLTERSGRD